MQVVFRLGSSGEVLEEPKTSQEEWVKVENMHLYEVGGNIGKLKCYTKY